MSEPKWSDALTINATRESQSAYLQRVKDALKKNNRSGAWLALQMGKSASHINTCLRNKYAFLPLNFIRAVSQWLDVQPIGADNEVE